MLARTAQRVSRYTAVCHSLPQTQVYSPEKHKFSSCSHSTAHTDKGEWSSFGDRPFCVPRLHRANEQSAWRPMSWVKGNNEEPLLQESRLGWWFNSQCDKYGEEEVLCIHDKGQRFSWKELREEARAFARGLLNLGVGKGDRVGVWMHNNAEWVIAAHACFLMGAVLVNVNPAYRSHELKEAMNQVGVRVLIVNRTFKTSNYVEMLTSLAPELSTHNPFEWRSPEIPTLRHVIVTDREGPKGLLNFEDTQQHYNDAVNIQFTSGTTGLPKGATLSHSNILNNGYFIGRKMRLSENDALCVPVPLYHCFGLVLGNLAAMTSGTRLVYPSESFDPKKTMLAVEEEKCTGLHGVPTMFIAMLNDPDFHKREFSTLRTGIMAGSICPIEVMKAVIDKMNLSDITIAYGMTETSPVSFQTSADDELEKRVETVGLVHPHIECKVIDTNGEVVEVGAPGELCTKGYSVMRSYWGDEEKTALVLQDGWMKTGDMVQMDEQGYCRVVGRIKDTIIRGGENIFPREIEDFLLTHPKLADAYIIGVPDKKFGEIVCAWCSVKDGVDMSAEEVQEYCRANIAHYKVPQHVIFDRDIPMTVTGKVQKHLMRKMAIERLAIEPDEVHTATHE